MNHPPYGRDFWPRTKRPEVAADLDIDRPCENCGYNLRGLTPRAPCPECGSVGGINTDDETIPWDERQSIPGFILTVGLVLARPRTFAKLVWNPTRFDGSAAKRFRRICLLIGVIALAAIAEELTRRTLGLAAALGALPFDLAGIVLWLNSVSLEPIAFVRATASPVLRRAEILAHYVSAVLVLTPIQLGLLVLTTPSLRHPHDWPIVAGMHLLALVIQLALGSIVTARMFFELVDVAPTRAIGFVLGKSLTNVASALPMLIALPALAGVLASRWFGG